MRILVTGASRGIGRAIATRLAADGAEIAACGSSHGDELASLVDELTADGHRAVALLGDLAEADVPARLTAEAVAALGGLDALVGNAAYAPPTGRFVDLADADWERAIAVNMRANWLLARAAHPHLKVSQAPSKGMVTISSIGGVEPYALMGVYAATKAALIQMTKVLAQEWAADGIRANCVSPGMVRTDMSAPIYDNPHRTERRLRLVPMGRIGMPEDTAGAVAWLLGADSSYVTGQNIIVDGGYLGSVQAHVSSRPPWTRKTD
ncbi:MAG: SDR family NAD(P)-dependent oxidoreductase [Alphaproteobacteria bacterium]